MFASIIVPVYNMRLYLARCVRSVLAQTLPDFELILVNDGSTDGSDALCDALAAEDSRVRVIHKENGGVSSARNLGLREAKGDFLLFLDSDDWYAPELLEELRKTAEATNADVVLFDWTIDDDESPARPVHPCTCQGEISPSEAYYLTVSNRNSFSCTKLFRRALCQGHQFREDVYWGEDTLFAAQCISEAKRCAYLPLAGYHYFMTQTSATRGSVNPEKQLSVIRAFGEIRQVTKANFPEHEMAAADTYYMHYINCLKNQRLSEEQFLQTADALRKELRGEFGKILFSRRITVRHKTKMLATLLNPRRWRK